jgi:hypothetical protein
MPTRRTGREDRILCSFDVDRPLILINCEHLRFSQLINTGRCLRQNSRRDALLARHLFGGGG